MPCAPIPLPPTSGILFKQIRRCSPRSWLHPPPAIPAADRLVSTIRSLSSARLLSAAVSAFSHLRLILPHSSSPHLEHPISSLLAASAALRSLSHGSALHALALSIGLLPANPHTVSRIAAFYAACGLLDDARAAVEESTAALAFSWNIVISAFLKNGYPHDAIFSYGAMLERGINPDNFTNSSVLKACADLRDLGLGKQLHQLINSSRPNWDLFVHNALLAMYAKCGSVDAAREVFDEMPERDVVSWNSMVQGYTSDGRWEETSELLERMHRHGFDPNSVTSNTIIRGHVRFGNHAEALRLISHARRRADIFAVDSVTLILGLKACAEIRYLKQGKEIHALIVRSACFELENINNSLITLYSKCRAINHARLLFPKSSDRTVVTWNAMIAAFSSTNNIREAIHVLQEMILSKSEPNHTTIVTMLSLCADASELWWGKQLHCYAKRHGFANLLPVANSIVDVYCKCGEVSVAHRVFDAMPDPDKISYTTLIAGYAAQRDRRDAMKLFDEMIARAIEPDPITIGAVRAAWRRPRSDLSVAALRLGHG
ncbi:Pentatricopeptide repeat-containing protein [Platanthera guangdongensis]|uniref:Pentatricopeptide repeat-containing protein n=1 Tax=Platanthera guangdongensis TaxID=2320717 RepID=A0ABR2MQK4_9ASPA